MTKCSFCGREQSPHKGVHVVKNNGAVNYYCTNKCRINSEKLGRDKRKVRWTEAFHITRKKARAREAETKEKAKSEKAAKSEAKSEKKQAKKKTSRK